MKILVVNLGSSSIKCSLFNDSSCLWEKEESVKESSVKVLMKLLASIEPPDRIGHRIVHGGRWFKGPALITKEVKEKIRKLSDLAPLHNLPQLEAIEALERHFKGVPQIAVFDTSFHHTISEVNAIYPGPYKWFEEGIMRYGFHGISYQYCAKKALELVKSAQKMVICHLGAGASLCAIKDGKSIDTTMGFTPLEGLMMDTRSGSIDPGIIFYLLEKREAKSVAKELYHESGLLGISGFSSDMKEILDHPKKGRSALALDIYIHRLNSLIGSMIASLQGIDLLVFTAGIGENSPLIRKRVCDNFSFLGIKLKDEETDSIISRPDSKVQVVVIHTDEALEIAQECLKYDMNKGGGF